MDNSNDETQRLVIDSTNISKSNSQPIPANRLALDAQIQAAADYQRRLRQRRRIYYIISITGVTMITFSILCFIAWIIHNGTAKGKVVLTRDPFVIETIQSSEYIKEDNVNSPELSSVVSPSSLHSTPNLKSTLNARKHPTRTLQNLIKRSEMESDEEKDETEKKRKPTRTRKLSFAPEMVIDYKPRFRPVKNE